MMPFHLRLATLVSLVGCLGGEGNDGAGEAVAVDAAFATRLTDGYACGIDSYVAYVAYDADRTIRLQTGFVTEYAADPGLADEGSFEEGVATLQLYTGTCLWTPGCTDDVSVPCEQEIAQIYEAVSGTLWLEETEAGVSGGTSDLVLEITRGEGDPVALPALDLELVPLWSED